MNNKTAKSLTGFLEIKIANKDVSTIKVVNNAFKYTSIGVKNIQSLYHSNK